MTATAINRAVHYRMCNARSCWSPAGILDEKITGNADLQVMSSDDKHQTWCEEACFERTTAQPARVLDGGIFPFDRQTTRPSWMSISVGMEI
jgi:hypothetical protein